MTTCGRVISGAWSTWWLCVSGVHALGHEALGLGVDHAVFFGDEEPGGDVFPSGFRYRFLDAPDGDGSLDRGEQSMFFCGGVVSEGIGKGVVRQPDPAVCRRA